MSRNWWVRFAVFLSLVLFSALSIVPTLTSVDAKKWIISKKMNLGLDLQGGLYIVLGIDFHKVYRDEVTSTLSNAQRVLQSESMNFSIGQMDVTDPEDPKLTVQLEETAKTRDRLMKYLGNTLRLVKEEGASMTFGLGRDFKADINANSVSRSIEVIRNRIDEFGVTEPEIVSQGQDRIVVQLPGVKDIQRARDLIGRTAKLEFKLVNDTIPEMQLNEWVEKAKKAGIEYVAGKPYSRYLQELNTFLAADLPQGTQIAFEKIVSKVTLDTTQMTPYLLEISTGLAGDLLEEAYTNIDPQQNRPYVGISFNSEGAKLFEEITRNNVNRRLAIVLDNNVYSAPNIQGAIAGGFAQITLGAGDANEVLKEARDLALVLRAGALPVELEFQEERVVGPSLGADSIKKAELASLVAIAFVFLFTVFYYKTAGFFASLTLVANVLFSLSCLVALEATLTLPGIAGIALTVGMAVDGNIIIYERIKEEIAKGVVAKEAVAIGFDKAFWTILDANITTAMAGLCLLNFGTGPVRGFAVTLLIGIVTTVYTSYFVSKIFFDWRFAGSSKNKDLQPAMSI
jgi:preprotein translocase subunit SecD